MMKNKLRLFFHNLWGHSYNIADAKGRCVVCGKPEPIFTRITDTYCYRPNKAIELAKIANLIGTRTVTIDIDFEQEEINRLIKEKNIFSFFLKNS